MRKKLIDLLCYAMNEYNPCVYCCGEKECGEVNIVADHLIANGVTVRAKGEWTDDPYVWRCNQCNAWLMEEDGTAVMNYCPNCGADMRQGAEHD